MTAVTEGRSVTALRTARPGRAPQHRIGAHGAHGTTNTMTLSLRGVVLGTTVRELPAGAGAPGGTGSGTGGTPPVAVPAVAAVAATRSSNEEEFSAYVRERRAAL